MKAFGWFSDLYEQVKDSFEFKLSRMELEITENILSIMKRRKMSRKDLAEKIGTSKAAISKLLNDGSNITLRRLLKISDAMDCQVKIDIIPVEHVAIYHPETPILLLKNCQQNYLSLWTSRSKGEVATTLGADTYYSANAKFGDPQNACAA